VTVYRQLQEQAQLRRRRYPFKDTIKGQPIANGATETITARVKHTNGHARQHGGSAG
jgi:hypothetical protein